MQYFKPAKNMTSILLIKMPIRDVQKWPIMNMNSWKFNFIIHRKATIHH